MMAGIKSKDTNLEMVLRRGLHRAGYRYRLHARDLPGSPDLVFPRHKAVIQANGCFWHGHDCELFKVPATNTAKWVTKIDRNRLRDQETTNALRSMGWRLLTVWECAVKGRPRDETDRLIERVCRWIDSGSALADFRGQQDSVGPGAP